jgi:hypothetical protein
MKKDSRWPIFPGHLRWINDRCRISICGEPIPRTPVPPTTGAGNTDLDLQIPSLRESLHFAAAFTDPLQAVFGK